MVFKAILSVCSVCSCDSRRSALFRLNHLFFSSASLRPLREALSGPICCATSGRGSGEAMRIASPNLNGVRQGGWARTTHGKSPWLPQWRVSSSATIPRHSGNLAPDTKIIGSEAWQVPTALFHRSKQRKQRKTTANGHEQDKHYSRQFVSIRGPI